MRSGRRFLRGSTAGLVATTLVAVGLTVFGPAVKAHANNGPTNQPPCVNGGVLSIGVRGSGEQLNAGAVTGRFFRLMRDNLGSIPNDQYDLPYDAAPWYQFAWAYKGSRDGGIGDLKLVLEDRAFRCTRETAVLVGYSQGADVIGSTLPQLGSKTRDYVSRVILFGDVKFNHGGHISCNNMRLRVDTPYGDWAKGNFSEHEADSCTATTTGPALEVSGAFGKRDPYLPPEFEHKTESWCDRNDPACTQDPSYAWEFATPWSSHYHYGDPGGWVDKSITPAARQRGIRLLESSGNPRLRSRTPSRLLPPHPTPSRPLSNGLPAWSSSLETLGSSRRTVTTSALRIHVTASRSRPVRT